jgi:hypothetical protein
MASALRFQAMRWPSGPCTSTASLEACITAAYPIVPAVTMSAVTRDGARFIAVSQEFLGATSADGRTWTQR